MKIAEIEVRSILSKTQIPHADYVANPYVGCSHACKYCYARFMKRFTGHREDWGEFLDIKMNSPNLLPRRGNFQDKKILFSSVTDPYLPQERDYKLTRRLLENLVFHDPSISILTKSDLVIRDLDVIKQFSNKEVGFSICSLDKKIQKQLEKRAPPYERRFKALKEIHENGIHNYLFISPILPFLTDWKSIIRITQDYVDYFMFENLNIAGSVWSPVKHWLELEHPNLVTEFKEIYFGNSPYWLDVEHEIINFCQSEGIPYKMYFHH